MRQMFSKGQLEKLIKTTPFTQKDAYETLMNNAPYTSVVFVDTDAEEITCLWKDEEDNFYGFSLANGAGKVGNYEYNNEFNTFQIDTENAYFSTYTLIEDASLVYFNLSKTNQQIISYGSMNKNQKDDIDDIITNFNTYRLFRISAKIDSEVIVCIGNANEDEAYYYFTFIQSSYLYEVKIDKSTKTLTWTPKSLFS